MKYKLLFFTIALILSTITLAQIGGDFEIKKSTIDGGGGSSFSGDFSLNGTIGQIDASDQISGGIYSLSGGFWRLKNNDVIFRNGFD